MGSETILGIDSERKSTLTLFILSRLRGRSARIRSTGEYVSMRSPGRENGQPDHLVRSRRISTDADSLFDEFVVTKCYFARP